MIQPAEHRPLLRIIFVAMMHDDDDQDDDYDFDYDFDYDDFDYDDYDDDDDDDDDDDERVWSVDMQLKPYAYKP